jgi:hypothetical protein
MRNTIAIATVVLAVVANTVVATSGSCSTCKRRPVPLLHGHFRSPVSLPCRFDCMQFITKNTKQTLFASCRNSVIAYEGDYFGTQQPPGFSISFQCLMPMTYQTFFTSRAKLAYVIGLCQNQHHACRRSGSPSVFNTAPGTDSSYPGLPSLADIALQTTAKYYQWYSQYMSVRVVNNIVRCPSHFKADRARFKTSPCGCQQISYPELFSGPNPKMPSAVSNGYTVAADVPSPVSPNPSYVQGFLGNYSGVTSGPIVEGDAEQLLAQARMVTVRVMHPVHLGCIDGDVDIITQCDG